MPIPLIPLDASLREGTVYLNQAIEQANASELVRQEALAAIVLTEQATSAANTAAGNATTQANTANASAYAADLAATAALNARDGANTAATNANTARTNANTATTQANAARDGANTAKASADTAAANANAKAALADTSASTADAAATRANTAAEAVEDALADGPVISVNGQNAIVDLTHEDVGAPSKTYTDTELAKKVDKEAGKGLFSGSYNDLTEKPIIPAAVTLNNTVTSTSTTQAATANAVKTAYDRAEAAFQAGNNVKSNTVSALLSVDDSLPITSNSNWPTIIAVIGEISTGHKVLVVPSKEREESFYSYVFTGLDFRPRIALGLTPSGSAQTIWASTDGSMPNTLYTSTNQSITMTATASGCTITKQSAAPSMPATMMFILIE